MNRVKETTIKRVKERKKNMTTKTITKELNLLDVKDIEAALSDYFERKISISKVNCILKYCIPEDTSELDDSYLEFEVGDDWCDSYDLWYNDEEEELLVNGSVPSFAGTCLRPEEIFNFDVSAFESFECEVDSSD